MHSLGAERSVNLFPAATWSGYHASEAPKAPYPGLRPTGSWILAPDGEVHGLDPAESGWRDRETGDYVDVSDRRLVLAYGSNPDPAKLLGKSGFLGGESVVALRAAVIGWAAAWCDARRGDGSVVATLVESPARVEVHPVLALTPRQLMRMDRWEGDPDCYRRGLFEGPVWLESGERREDVEVYIGTPELRPPYLAEGRPYLCADVAYAEIHALVD